MTASGSKTIVLFDGECALCRKTTGILKRFDWLHQLQFHNCREVESIPANEAHLDPERMIAEMHVLSPDRRMAVSGFRAVRSIARHLPVLWPIFPLLFVPGMTRLGQKIYLWIARNRFQLVPCHESVCTIPPKR